MKKEIYEMNENELTRTKYVSFMVLHAELSVGGVIGTVSGAVIVLP